VGQNGVWVIDADRSVATRIDPASLQVVATVPLPGSPAAIAIDPQTDAPWVVFS
jgi:DNA-binding beta-propeller fold protein YncE